MALALARRSVDGGFPFLPCNTVGILSIPTFALYRSFSSCTSSLPVRAHRTRTVFFARPALQLFLPRTLESTQLTLGDRDVTEQVQTGRKAPSEKAYQACRPL